MIPLFALFGCIPSGDIIRHTLVPLRDSGVPVETGLDTDTPGDSGYDTDLDPDTGLKADPCGLHWDEVFVPQALPFSLRNPAGRPWTSLEEGDGAIAHIEPYPPGYRRLLRPGAPPSDLVLPDYSDDMPLFERGTAWTTSTRCYDTPIGAMDLSEEEAHDLYVDLAEATTGVPVDTSEGHRTVIGVRGAYPGTFWWHGNAPNVFNDTLVLLWTQAGEAHVREFPVNTDTGDYDFGEDSSSSLRPNRRYHYQDYWHREYNALSIDESGYHVHDDDNANGHWDSDRNGWLPPYNETDHDRTGSGHNIHMASVDGPLGSARVDNWSAGCQTIPGMANWESFIDVAWEGMNASADYFLLDVRDMAPEVWTPCTPDGTHGCPYRMESFPFTVEGDTSNASSELFNVYNCSSADESGPEDVYVFTLDRNATVDVSVEVDDGVDVDVHLLEGDDPDACLARDDVDLSHEVTPGRYFVVVDTFVDGEHVLAGGYRLRVTMN